MPGQLFARSVASIQGRSARRVSVPVLVSFFLAWMPDGVFACPGCIEATSPDVYTGFLWGMGVMMAMPFVLLLVVGGGLLHARRSALAEEVERLLDDESVQGS
jgi:hypothetical protein